MSEVGSVTAALSCEPRWWLGLGFRLAALLVGVGILSRETAARWLVRHGLRITVQLTG